MQLTCSYTSDFEPLLIRFLSGIPEDLAIHCIEFEADHLSGIAGGIKSWKFRADLFSNLANPKNGIGDEIQIICDIDVVVYGDLRKPIEEALMCSDIVFQREWGSDRKEINCGVIAFRKSKKIFEFWSDVRKMIDETNLNEQELANRLISNPLYLSNRDIKVGRFPKSFFARSHAILTSELHIEDVPFDDIVLHHANCISEIGHKWKQLNSFKRLFRPSEQTNSFALIKTLLQNVEWTFGLFSDKDACYKISFDEHLFVRGFENPNVFRAVIRDDMIIIVSRDGRCMAYINEFYVDPHRGKVMMLGPTGDNFDFGNGFNFLYFIANDATVRYPSADKIVQFSKICLD
jgi:hypothetical protein